MLDRDPPRSLSAALRDLQHHDPTVRSYAARALGFITLEEPHSAIEALFSALGDEVHQVRYEAALALAEIFASHTTVAPARLTMLAETLERERDTLVRQALVIACGRIGGKAAVSVLASLIDDEDDDVRYHLPAALVDSSARLDALDEVPTLLVKLSRDQRDLETRANAIAALGDIGHTEIAEELRTLLNPRTDRSVRLEAALALSRFGDAEGTKALIEHLGDRGDELDVARRLYEAGGVPKDHELQQAIVHHAARSFVSGPFKAWMAGVLLRIDETAGKDRLEKLMRSKDRTAAGLTIEILGDILTRPESPRPLETWARSQLESFATEKRGRPWQAELQSALRTSARNK
jgi:HEAT repeat protein